MSGREERDHGICPFTLELSKDCRIFNASGHRICPFTLEPCLLSNKKVVYRVAQTWTGAKSTPYHHVNESLIPSRYPIALFGPTNPPACVDKRF